VLPIMVFSIKTFFIMCPFCGHIRQGYSAGHRWRQAGIYGKPGMTTKGVLTTLPCRPPVLAVQAAELD